MTAPDMPSLPAAGDKPWTDWGDGIQAVVAWVLATVQAGAPVDGPVNMVNGVTPDITGNVALVAGDVNALPDSYKPPVSDLPPFVFPIVKDPITGFWPSGWDSAWNPTYVGASGSTGTRPTADPRVVCEWQCSDAVFPPPVASGTGGMLSGRDRPIITG